MLTNSPIKAEVNYVRMCLQRNYRRAIKEVVSKGHQGREALAKLGVGDSCGVCVLDALKNLSAKYPTLTKKSQEKPKK